MRNYLVLGAVGLLLCGAAFAQFGGFGGMGQWWAAGDSNSTAGAPPARDGNFTGGSGGPGMGRGMGHGCMGNSTNSTGCGMRPEWAANSTGRGLGPGIEGNSTGRGMGGMREMRGMFRGNVTECMEGDSTNLTGCRMDAARVTAGSPGMEGIASKAMIGQGVLAALEGKGFDTAALEAQLSVIKADLHTQLDACWAEESSAGCGTARNQTMADTKAFRDSAISAWKSVNGNA